MGVHQGAVAETLPHPLTFDEGVRLAPSATAVGASINQNVNVFRQVVDVVFPLVGGHHKRAVLGCDDSRNAVVL